MKEILKNNKVKLNVEFVMFLTAIFLSVANATDNSFKEFGIENITPIKRGMTLDQAKEAVNSFLQKEVFLPENEILFSDIIKEESVHHNGDPENSIIYDLITLKDGTQWVKLPARSLSAQNLQRFLGALYLDKSIKHHNAKDIKSVTTKFVLSNPQKKYITVEIKSDYSQPLTNVNTITSLDVCSLSLYMGDERYTKWRSIENNLRGVGFHDLNSSNLRCNDDQVTIIDTEYTSLTYQHYDGPFKKKELIDTECTSSLHLKKITFSLDELRSKK